MREIGGEFWDVPVTENGNHLFPESVQWFLSGRSALQAIITHLHGCHTVAMPSWCCDSMVKPFIDAGMKVSFYPVYQTSPQKGIVQEIKLNCDVLFLIDYFGYNVTVPDISKNKGLVIRDITHSIFSQAYTDANYYFGSLRKWCGIWTGGYAWTADGSHLKIKAASGRGDEYISLRKEAMQKKWHYIRGDVGTDKTYLALFDKAEEFLEKNAIVPAAERDVQLAQRLNTAYIISRRRGNAKKLMDAFSDWLIFPEMREAVCPMFVPVLVPDGKRDALRRYLIQNEIYCPVHWPVSVYHRLDKTEQSLYSSELSLVCDQRYTEEDMARIIQTVKKFWKER